MTDPEDIFPDTPQVDAFMDSITHLNDGFIRLDEDMFRLYFTILTENEPIAPYVLQPMSYESVMGRK